MDTNLACTRCGRLYPLSKLRNITDNKNRTCIDCLKKLKTEPEKPKVQIPEKRKVRFKCRKCDHVFILKEGFAKTCPFCSSSNITNQEWNSDLDQLIRDSGQRIYDN